MSDDLNLNPHVILAQSLHSHRRPDRLMIRHPLPEVADHDFERFIVQRHMVGVDPEDLFPALAAGVLEIAVDVLECLVDLLVDVAVDFEGVGVPAAYGAW